MDGGNTGVPQPQSEWEKRAQAAAGKKAKRTSSYKEWAVALAVAVLMAVLLTQAVFINAQIPSSSMENTIMTGDRVLGLRFSYWFSAPQRGDIIIFRWPDNEDELFVKRTVGLPGDTVDIRDGRIYLNGSAAPLEEGYLREAPKGSFGPYVVPEGSYLVLGDNRNNSLDSRYWNNTYVPLENIVGKAVARVFPNPAPLR